MASIFNLMLLLSVLLGQGGSDLLDTIPSDAYWSAKGIAPTEAVLLAQLQAGPAQAPDISKDIQELGANEYNVRLAARQRLAAMGPAIVPQLKKAEAEAKDPEIIGACRDLAAKMTGSAGGGNVRKLMAIRTLGELKAKGAVEALKGLEKSPEPFVAEYAARALAQIEGRPLPQADTAARRDADVWLLPASSGIVGQINNSTPTGLTLAALVDQIPARNLESFRMTREQARKAFITQVMSLADSLGNVRLDSLTLGVANDVGDRSGWVVFVASGRFDPDSLGKLLAPLCQMHGPAEGAGSGQPRKEGSLTIYDGREVCFLIEGDHRVVMIAGPDAEHVAAARTPMMEALQAGKGKLAASPEMAKLVRNADRAQPVWAVARISDVYRAESGQTPVLAGFESFTGAAKIKDGLLQARITGQGVSKEAMQTGIDQVTKEIDTMVKNAEDRAKRSGPAPDDATFTAIFKSLKVQATGETAAVLTGELKLDTVAQMIAREFLTGILRSNMGGAPRPAVPPTVSPIPAPAEGPAIHEDGIVVPGR